MTEAYFVRVRRLGHELASCSELVHEKWPTSTVITEGHRWDSYSRGDSREARIAADQQRAQFNQ